MLGRRISHYLIKGELGRGGMGVVYLAVDARLDREVALKFLPVHLSADAQARARFIQEARAASALNHPSICSVYDIGESEDGRTFMVMPFYEGQTIREMLSEGPLPVQDARRVAAGVAYGLSAAHDAGIIHRDIKPANVIVGPDGRITILDFGVAKFGAGEDLTKDGSTVGTTSFMSPEQARGEEATFRSDLWSLGVLLYEMLAGVQPFSGGYEAATAYAIINQSPAPLPDAVPSDLSDLVAALMEKTPERRPASASAVRQALEGSGAAVEATSGEVAPEPIVTRSLARWSAGVLALALLAFLLTRFWPAGTETSEVLDAIAVMPFDVQAGPELEYMDRGMVNMLSPMLDGLGGIRAVDPKALLGLVEQGNYDLIDPIEGAQIAREFAARWFMLGSLSRYGSALQLTATLYDAQGRQVRELSHTVTSEDSLLVGARGLMTGFLGDLVDQSGGTNVSLAIGTSTSFSAMKAYIRAEEHYRAGRFTESLKEARQALEEDSTFAAAWYLAANASAQENGTLTQSYRSGSLRHIHGTPDRLQRLIRARAATVHEGAFETIKQLREILKRYPDDLDATAYIADQTYHLAPQIGQPANDATSGFFRVLALSPGNGEYLGHLAQLLYQAEEFDALDSLRKSFSILVDAPQYRALDLMHYFEPQNREDYRDSLLAAPEEGLSFWLMQTGHIRATLEVLRDRIEAGRPVANEERILGPVLESAIGRRDGYPYDGTYTPEEVLQLAAERAAFQTYLPVPDDSLRALMASLRALPSHRFSPLLGSASAVFGGRERFRPYAYEESGDDVAAYLRAVLADRLGDRSTMREELEFLRSPDKHRLARALADEVEARLLLAEERPAEALSVIESGVTADPVPYFPFLARWLSHYYERAHERFLRARILFELGRYDEAIRWSESVHDGFQLGTAPVLLPLTFRLEAEAFMALQDWENAADRYERFIRLWEDAVPELQPQVDEARLRLQEALDRGISEPGT